MADPLPNGTAGVKVAVAARSERNPPFTGVGANRIGRITPNGTLTEFPTCPDCGSLTRASLRGGRWYTDVGANRIGRITLNGTITEFPTAVELASRAS